MLTIIAQHAINFSERNRSMRAKLTSLPLTKILYKDMFYEITEFEFLRVVSGVL